MMKLALLTLSLYWSATSAFSPLPLPQSSTRLHSEPSAETEAAAADPAFYAERSAKVAEAAQAGKSRWGDAENQKAMIMMEEQAAEDAMIAEAPRETAGPLTVQSMPPAAAAAPSSLVTPIPAPEMPTSYLSSVSNPAWATTPPLSDVWNKQISWDRQAAGLAAPTKFPTGLQVSPVSDPGWSKASPLSEVWNKQSSWDRNDAGLPAQGAGVPLSKPASKLVSSGTTDPAWAKDISPEGALGTVWNKQSTMGMLGVNPEDYKKYPDVSKQISVLEGYGGNKPLSIVWYKAY